MKTQFPPSRPIRCGHANGQRGVVLFIALIALVALSLAGIALYRSVESGNTVAGNLAFRQATLQASDHGVEAAFINIRDIISNAQGTNILNEYRHTRLDAIDEDTPRAVNWAKDIAWGDTNYKCRDNSNSQVPCANQDYQIKYFVERLCSCPVNVTDASAITPTGSCPASGLSTILASPRRYCNVNLGSGKGGSKGQFTTPFESVDAIYYRVTVRVTGPRNTTTYVQTIVSKG
jgi:Tfp pilus assembly protein PilX